MQLENVQQLNELKNKLVADIDPDKPYISICAGTGCLACGCKPVLDEFEKVLEAKGLTDKVILKPTGCHGFCERGPVTVIHPQGIFYQQIKPEDVEDVVEQTIVKGEVVERLLYTDPQTEEAIVLEEDVPFYKHQQRIVFADNGKLNPRKIEDYIQYDGYQGLAKALFEMTSDEVISEVKDSGLKGRGGGGFSTGTKWEFCRKSPGDDKFIICNADEGDPGAYMDRSVLEGNPHSVVEGMIIGGYAIGANTAYVYIRAEYPLAVENLKHAINEAKRCGLLGRNILGSGFNFNIKISMGGGAFVCGEETALIASLEGRPGDPRPRPPYPAASGLWGKPTNVNNVESWSNIPHIIRRGAGWYSSIGTETSKGTKIFSLVGKINNTGLVEVPMGTKLSDIIYNIGGGIPKGKAYKAVQTGGPSGGCIPSKMIGLKIDFEELKKVDSIMGSGGLIVMDESTCMVDVARYFLEFLKEESCGQCVPCREGIDRSLEVLNRIVKGEGTEEDIPLLEELATTIQDFSLCGLGQTAPNPLLSTLKHYRNEYEEHIKYKRCTAAVCDAIISAPCQHTCPIDTKTPVYIAQVAHGDLEGAWETISMDNPMPGVCGRVCNHPCERKCRAGDGGDEISIRGLKRYVTDHARAQGWKPVAKAADTKRDEKIAIIGAGPAGLAAGKRLAMAGFGVTIFDKLPIPGGMLLAGIPEYRLPRDIIAEEVQHIVDLGVEIQCDKTLGEDFTVEELLSQGYKAVFIATGAHKSMPMRIEGEEADGVYKSMDYLTKVNVFGEKIDSKKVVVVGGGNSAVDAARVALRQPGVEKVSIVYRRTRAEMPAFKEEVTDALAEGIDIRFLANPVKVHVTDGKVSAIDCIQNELGDFDSSGRRRPVPIEGSEFTLDIDTMITAIGERPNTFYVKEDSGLKLTRWDSIEASEETTDTGVEAIFAGGDCVTGPNTVIDAIAAGQQAAESIRRWVDGEALDRTYDVTKRYKKIDAVEVPDEEMTNSNRAHPDEMPVNQRVGSFDEIVPVLSKDEAMREARRCLRCDLG